MSRRIQQVNQLIKEEVARLLYREIEFPPATLITVTRAETSPDLKESKVFLSIIPEEKTKRVFKSLKKRVYYLQKEINKRLKMKPVPKIIFREERRTMEAARIEEILKRLKGERKID